MTSWLQLRCKSTAEPLRASSAEFICASSQWCYGTVKVSHVFCSAHFTARIYMSCGTWSSSAVQSPKLPFSITYGQFSVQVPTPVSDSIIRSDQGHVTTFSFIVFLVCFLICHMTKATAFSPRFPTMKDKVQVCMHAWHDQWRSIKCFSN